MDRPRVLARLPLVNPDKLHRLVLPAATAFACQRACKQLDHFATQIIAVKNRLQAIDRFAWPGLEEAVFAEPFALAARFFREHWYDPQQVVQLGANAIRQQWTASAVDADAEFTVSMGERVPFVVTWTPTFAPVPDALEAVHELDATATWWRAWSNRCTYQGAWREAALRSLITLKALTYAPTGGLVAAATTSLPEQLGGVRNWDYRYCWLRDATFTLYALMTGGYTDEAQAWRNWLVNAVAGEPAKLQIMYGLAGERRLTELELDWLPGYEGPVPVRIGNGASTSTSLMSSVDASLLMLTLVGFLPASAPRMIGTVAAVQAQLTRDGFVERYLTSSGVDGLPPGEGAFLICSFWLADNLALQGRTEEARELFERLLALRNDVGLLSEEYDPLQ